TPSSHSADSAQSESALQRSVHAAFRHTPAPQSTGARAGQLAPVASQVAASSNTLEPAQAAGAHCFPAASPPQAPSPSQVSPQAAPLEHSRSGSAPLRMKLHTPSALGTAQL